MKTPLLSTLPLLLTLAFASPCISQELRPSKPGTPGPLSSIGDALQTAHGVGVYDGVTIGGGPDYHAVFEPGGMRFTPALGKRAKELYPVRFHLESIRRGKTVFRRPATDDATLPRLEGSTVTYDRDGIAERYDVCAEGVEQSFLFPTRPPGRGDLVVRLRVVTELSAKAGRRLQTMKFDHPDLGGVSIGAVTGIDAAQRTAAGHLNFDGEHLELVLPDEFVANARYPMVLDPIVGGYLCPQCAGNHDAAAKAAYDTSTDRYLVVWQRFFSATNVAIRAQRMNATTGTNVGSWIAITPQLKQCYNAVVANINLRNMFVVAWQERPRSTASFDLKARAVNASSGAVYGELVIAATSSDETNPDICGDSTTKDDDVCIVWDDSSRGILWAEVGFLSSGQGIVLRRRTISSSNRAEFPAICKHGGEKRRTFVAWDNGGNQFAARAMSLDSAFLSAIGAVAGKNPGRPRVAGDGERFMMVFQDVEPTTTLHDVWCIDAFVPSHPGQLWTATTRRTIEADRNDDEREPDVACLGDKWLVVYMSNPSNTGTALRMRTFLDRCQPCGRAFLGGTNKAGWYALAPRLVSQRSGGRVNDRGLVVFHEQQGTKAGNIRGYRFHGAVGFPPTKVLSGCTGGGTMSTTGKFSFGERYTFRLSGADPRATFGLFTASHDRTRFSCGTCPMVIGPWLIPVAVRNGTASISVRLPCDPRAYGIIVDSQFWVARTGSSPCGIAPGLGVSNILRNKYVD